MIIVSVEVRLEDGQSVDGIRDAFRLMDEASRNEDGCLKYVSSVDVNDPAIVRIDEIWESMEALEPHFRTPHIAAFQKALGGIKTKSMDAKIYEVEKELPFPNG